MPEFIGYGVQSEPVKASIVSLWEAMCFVMKNPTAVGIKEFDSTKLSFDAGGDALEIVQQSVGAEGAEERVLALDKGSSRLELYCRDSEGERLDWKVPRCVGEDVIACVASLATDGPLRDAGAKGE